MKERFFVAFASTVIFMTQALASNFYNVDSADQIHSGQQVNVDYNLGITTSPTQATLIHPQVAITAIHGQLRRACGANERIRFGDQEYRIVRKEEPADAQVGFKDFCLLFLDRPVEGAQVCPLARLDNIVRELYVHALSHNQNRMINGRIFRGNPNRLLTYGRAYCRVMDPLWANTMISISIPENNAGHRDMVVPIGGDSGSSCFISTNRGLALAGVMSSVSDDRPGNGASYIALYQHKVEIERMIAAGLGIQNCVLAEIGSDDWVLQPDCLSNILENSPVPVDFRADDYMRGYPDLQRAFGQLEPRQREIALASHYTNSGRRAGRIVLPKLFNPLLYLHLNPDLAAACRNLNLNGEARLNWAISHYIKAGRFNASRLYLPQDFNPQRYMDLNPDIRDAYNGSEDEATSHFVWHGYSKGRRYN